MKQLPSLLLLSTVGLAACGRDQRTRPSAEEGVGDLFDQTEAGETSSPTQHPSLAQGGGSSSGGKGASRDEPTPSSGGFGGSGSGGAPSRDLPASSGGESSGGGDGGPIITEVQPAPGDYLLHHDVPTQHEGCTRVDERFFERITIGRPDLPEAYWIFPHWSTLTREGVSLSTETSGWLPEATFEMNEEGVIFSGSLSVEYDCAGTTTAFDFPITVQPTHPVISAHFSFPGSLIPAGAATTFTTHGFLAPASDPDNFDPVEITNHFAARLTSNETLLESRIEGSKHGPRNYFLLSETQEVQGTAPGSKMEYFLKESLVGVSGQEAELLQPEITFLDSGDLIGLELGGIDFDAGTHPGATGAVTYHAPGSENSPCESGGCLELKTSRSCDEIEEHGPESFLAFRINSLTTPDQAIRIRARILSDSPQATGLSLWMPHGVCSGRWDRVKAAAKLSEPILGYDYGTDWFDHHTGSCIFWPDSTRTNLDVVLSTSCSERESEPLTSIIVETVEVIEWPP